MELEQAKHLLWAQIQMDIRIRVHGFEEVDKLWKHTNKCPRCCALYILGQESDLMVDES